MPRTLINTQTSSWPGAAVVGGSRASCVVCARWCPTLPHPGGCSTIGAVRLSFRVRDGCRAFPCRCDHRDDCTGSAWAVVCCCGEGYSIVWLSGLPADHTLRVWLVVGLGVDRIVDAYAAYRAHHPPPFFDPAYRLAAGAWCVCLCVVGLGVDRIVDAHALTFFHRPRVWGCCCLCWPISTSQLTDRCRSSTPGLSTQ